MPASRPKPIEDAEYYALSQDGRIEARSLSDRANQFNCDPQTKDEIIGDTRNYGPDNFGSEETNRDTHHFQSGQALRARSIFPTKFRHGRVGGHPSNAQHAH
jgi:hypothetical protein